MSNSQKKIMLRVIKKRLDAGETLEEIFKDYPKLTDDEKQELEEELG